MVYFPCVAGRVNFRHSASKFSSERIQLLSDLAELSLQQARGFDVLRAQLALPGQFLLVNARRARELYALLLILLNSLFLFFQLRLELLNLPRAALPLASERVVLFLKLQFVAAAHLFDRLLQVFAHEVVFGRPRLLNLLQLSVLVAERLVFLHQVGDRSLDALGQGLLGVLVGVCADVQPRADLLQL